MREKSFWENWHLVLPSANEIAHLELNSLFTLTIGWTDKKEMTIFGSDSVVQEKDGFLTVCEQQDDL